MPGVADVMRVRAKWALLVERWHARDRGERFGRRPPALLLPCGGTPRTVLVGLGLTTPGAIASVWFGAETLAGLTMVIDLVHLDSRLPGTSVLRLMRRARDDAAAQAALEALSHDPWVLDSTKDMLIEAMIRGRVPMERQEHERAIDFERRIGALRGIGQSLFEVLELRGLVPDKAAHERIASCEDVDVLRRWLRRAVTAERLEDVFVPGDDG